MAFMLKSYNQIVGDMIRKTLSVTGINDMNKGSVIMTILEASAQELFAQYGALIDILDSFYLDNLTGIDLDKKGAEYGLDRLPATNSSGFVTIGDSTFTKVFSTVYIGSTPPIAGDTSIKVADAEDFLSASATETFPGSGIWNDTGSIYVGRGTSNFEGAIAYTQLIDHSSYWEIKLSVPLSKDHTLSETVIKAQGTNRTIATGTLVRIPANNISNAVLFSVINESIVADGEDTLNNVLVKAVEAGINGNAPLNSIIEFETEPFNGATVTNITAFSNARDLETDQEFRDRIKEHIQSLSKGTKLALLTGVIGVSDSDENKRVVSASMIEPTTVTDIAKLYIDDGTGFEPSYAGKGYEEIISDAVGTEQFLQLANFPIVKAQVETLGFQPFALSDGDTLIIRVNDEQETITFNTANFDVIGSARAVEVAEVINDNANLIEARTHSGQTGVVIFAKAVNNEKIQVVGGTANDVLLFSTDEVFTLRLYKNNIELSKDGATAFLESTEYNNWAAFGSPYTLTIQVDNKPYQYIRLEDNKIEISTDGATWTQVDVLLDLDTFVDLGTTVIAADIASWVTVLDQIIQGATVTANGSQIKITSNSENAINSQIQIIGGSLANTQGWPTTASVGKASDYDLNRFNGQIELTTPLVGNDKISAGSFNTRGNLLSIAASGNFDLTNINGRLATLYITIDGNSVIRPINFVGTETIAVTNTGGDVWKYTSSTAAFSNLQVGDYVVVVGHNAPPVWLSAGNIGIFEVTAVDGAAFWFEVNNPIGAAEGPFTMELPADIQAFYSDVPPQKIEFANSLQTPAIAVANINAKLIGGQASVEDNNKIRILTNTYDSSIGAIHIPVIIAGANNFGFSQSLADSETSHVAAESSSDQLGYPDTDSDGVITTADSTDPYVDVIDAGNSFSGNTKYKNIVKYLDSTNKLLKGIVRSIPLATQITLRDNTPPTLGIVDKDFLNSIHVGANFYQFHPYDFGQDDNLVVVMDGDSTNKTFNVPLYRSGQITNGATLSSFDADDTDANVAGTSFGSSLWDAYDFSDYKVWMKARQVIDPTNADNAIIFRAVNYGPDGERIKIGYFYPTLPNQDLSVDFNPEGVTANSSELSVYLASGNEISTGAGSTTIFDIVNAGATTTYTENGGAVPNFGPVGVGDIVTFNCPTFSSVNNGTFYVSAKTPNSLTVLNVGFTEAGKLLTNDDALRVFSLDNTENTATKIVSLINNDDVVKNIMEAIVGSGESGAGTIDYSTLDDPAIASKWLDCVDGENFVRDFRVNSETGAPLATDFVLKYALQFTTVGAVYDIGTAPNVDGTVGEPFRLIPTTLKNVTDHFNKTTITALSSSAEITRAYGGDKLQIASLELGTEGQVLVSGGLGNANVATVQDAAVIHATSFSVRSGIATSLASGFHANQMIRVINQNQTKKFTTFDSNTQVTVSNVGANTQKYELQKRITNIAAGTTFLVSTAPNKEVTYTITAGPGDFLNCRVGDELQVNAVFNPANIGDFPIIAIDPAGTWVTVKNIGGGFNGDAPVLMAATDIEVQIPFYTEFQTDLDGTTEMKVEYLSQNIWKFTHTGIGTAPIFRNHGITAEDWVVIGGNFATGNKGKFKIITSEFEYFLIENPNGVAETLLPGAASMQFYAPDSVFVSDTLVVAEFDNISWFDADNQGIMDIVAVGKTGGTKYHYVNVTNSTFAAETITLGSFVNSFFVLENELYDAFKIVTKVALNPSDTSQSYIYYEAIDQPTRVNANRISAAGGSQFYSLNKLDFPTATKVGIDGYKYWTGLLRKVQRVIDGYEADITAFPGLKAAGVQVEPLPPLLQRVSVSLDVRTIERTPLAILTDSIKSTVLAYIASLGVGSDVLLSEIVKRVQNIPGVETVHVIDPVPSVTTEPRIIIQDNEKAIAFQEDIIIG